MYGEDIGTASKGTTDMTKATTPDETRIMTLDEVRALPGLLGRVAAIMVERKGWYGYTDTATGRKILIVRA